MNEVKGVPKIHEVYPCAGGCGRRTYAIFCDKCREEVEALEAAAQRERERAAARSKRGDLALTSLAIMVIAYVLWAFVVGLADYFAGAGQ